MPAKQAFTVALPLLQQGLLPTKQMLPAPAQALAQRERR
jgi:hypothetical protein